MKLKSLAIRESQRAGWGARLKQVVSERLWAALSEASNAKGRRHAAVAYVTSEKKVAFRAGDLLVVDASNQAIKSSKTSRSLLRTLFKRGVIIRSIPGLHAKLIAFPDEAFIGSMNFSDNSPKLTEAAFHTKNRAVIAQVREFVRTYAAVGDEVGKDFLKRIAKLKLVPAKKFSTPPKRITSEPRLWLISTWPLSQKIIDREADAAKPGEEEAAEHVARGFYAEWIRFGRTSRFKFVRDVRLGDQLIIIFNEDRTTSVWRNNYMISIDKKDNWKRVHYQSRNDERSITWQRFQRIWKASGGPDVTKDAMRLVPNHIAERLRSWLDSK